MHLMGSEKLSGVYAITHIPSGRAYIGSSKDIYGRWAGHQKSLRAGNHRSPYFQKSWNKHGAQEFHFGILEKCVPDLRIQREQFWIDQIQASNKLFGFNVSPLAHAPCPGEEGRARIGLANKKRIGVPWKAGNHELWKANISAGRTGKKYGPRDPSIGMKIAESLRGQPLSEERKAKISKALIGMVRGPHSEEHKRNLSLSHSARSPEEQAKINEKSKLTRLAKKEANNGK